MDEGGSGKNVDHIFLEEGGGGGGKEKNKLLRRKIYIYIICILNERELKRRIRDHLK
jgi:ribosomal protein L36